MAKSRNFSGSTELLKAHTKHFPSRRASRIQTRGAASALCSTEEHMYLMMPGSFLRCPAGRRHSSTITTDCRLARRPQRNKAIGGVNSRPSP